MSKRVNLKTDMTYRYLTEAELVAFLKKGLIKVVGGDFALQRKFVTGGEDVEGEDSLRF